MTTKYRTTQLPSETPKAYLARLRRMKREICKELDELKAKTPPPSIIDAFRSAIRPPQDDDSPCKSENISLYNRTTAPTNGGMTLTAPSKAAIARAYKVTRQGLHNLCKGHGFTIEDLLEPDIVFARLLENGNAARTRGMLSNPANREAIRKTLTA
jgi:hypothetical protein